MTLLDQCVKKGLDIIVAHVNYQKRESAKRDELLVRDYCDKHHVPFFVAYCPTIHKGNFQGYARKFRYDFFRDLCEKEKCDCVLVAHQQDDLFETYLIQCQRKSVPLFYGLKEEVIHHGIVIQRPLLDMTKKECYQYCFDNDVPFGEDESNFSNDYLRNRLRKEVVDAWSEERRAEVLEEIKQRNEEKFQEEVKIKKVVDTFDEDLDVETFKKLENPMDVLRFWLYRHKVGFSISNRRLRMICETIIKDESNYEFEVDDVTLMKSYDVIQLVKDVEYSYTFDTIDEFECEYFKISKDGSSVEAVTLYESDFPITVRSPNPMDTIQLRFGRKKINRFFIDRKISHKERKTYPIVVNCKGNVILVPKLGCDVEHYTVKPNCFVLK